MPGQFAPKQVLVAGALTAVFASSLKRRQHLVGHLRRAGIDDRDAVSPTDAVMLVPSATSM